MVTGSSGGAPLCSVPPSQASYLQRIGRAGRRDGNALLLTIASACPHDRWFWEQPEEMLAGEIAPPGLFLDATAVLERHLAAFCLDRWIAHAGEAAELPTMLGRVLDAVKIRDTRLFPYPFLEFVDAHEARLHGEFAEMFRQWASPGTLESLRGFLHGRSDEGSLGFGLLALFDSEHKQVEALRADARRLAAEIKALQALPVAPTDLAETVAELQGEKEGLQRLATAARARHLLEFLTDYGALPNYAFPEAAARLRTVIFRKKADKRDDAERGYQSWSYEYVRAPANALGEFAPGSTFYTGGYQVKTDRVDLASQGVESWRFCPSCNHSERVDDRDEHLRCPACDDPTWPDPAQRQRLLRLTKVFASTSARRGRIRDDSDERRPQIHSRQMLVGVSDANRKCAFMLDPDKAVFAFEFIERARFSDLTFGEPTNDGAKSLIAGSERVRGGFRVCRECGTVQPRRGKARHTKFCPSQKKAREPQIEECLYLLGSATSACSRPRTCSSGSSPTP
jgi:DEAD/DEAH box helicase domain-containing protein